MTPFLIDTAYARDQFADRDTRTRLTCRSRRGACHCAIETSRRASRPPFTLANWRTCDSCLDKDTPRKAASDVPYISIKVGKRFADLIGFYQFAMSRTFASDTARREDSEYSQQLGLTIKGIVPVCRFEMRDAEREAEKSFEVY